MPDGRMLHKKISLNEAIADLENDTHRLLFTWAIAHLDIKGRLTGSPRQFKAIVAPLLEHITPKTVQKFFADAQSKGLIYRYEVDGIAVVEYPKFSHLQKLRADRESPSKLPAPPLKTPEPPGNAPDSPEPTPDQLRSNPGVLQSKSPFTLIAYAPKISYNLLN
jgi:hypothetical protein